MSASALAKDANLCINGGFFIFQKEIFDYMLDGDEFVEAPFQRLIEADQLMASGTEASGARWIR